MNSGHSGAVTMASQAARLARNCTFWCSLGQVGPTTVLSGEAFAAQRATGRTPSANGIRSRRNEVPVTAFSTLSRS
jgi:hypothetical protein